MKKLLLILCAAVFLASCEKMAEPTVNVTFSVTGVESGAMTKSLNSDVAALLELVKPSMTPTVTLKSTTNPLRTYTVKVGETVSLVCDTYTASGRCTDNVSQVGAVFDATLFNKPTYKISQNVTINKGGQVTLTATYDCAGLVINYAMAESYALSTPENDKTTAIFDGFTKSGDLGIVFLHFDYMTMSRALRLLVTPANTIDYESKMFYLGSPDTNNDEVLRLNYGTWYCFNPGEIEKSTGSLSFTLPGWSGVTY